MTNHLGFFFAPDKSIPTATTPYAAAATVHDHPPVLTILSSQAVSQHEGFA